MREIKFRAWEEKSNYMFTWRELKNQQLDLSNIKNYSIFEDNSLELMQYTGLKDKNGVEIYEGDIVKDLRSMFKDNRANCRAFYQEDRGRYVFGGWEIPAGMMQTFEVIGNIYENPELLDG